jgi:hypothetical protein
MNQHFRKITDSLFPDQKIYNLQLSRGVSFLLFIGLTIVFSLVAGLIPMTKFLGFDWVNFWGAGKIPSFYPPWTIYLTKFLTYPLLVGITLSAFCVATIQRSCHPVSAICAFLSLPLIWTVFLGQLEGLSVLGLLGLPWLIPLVLVKPQIAFFGLGAKRSSILAFIVFLIISYLIWRNWPGAVLAADSSYAEGRYPQNIGLGLWGLPFFLLTVWFSRGDMDMLMVSGAFISPHLIFYNLLPLTPAVARLKPRAAFVAVILSFLTLSSNWLGPMGWWLGWGFVPWLWINLAAQRYPEAKFAKGLNFFSHYETK